jgi:hypothetical protein
LPVGVIRPLKVIANALSAGELPLIQFHRHGIECF